jgi:hypothetical protein
MLRWLHRRRERLKRIEAEADTLIQHLGVEASSAEARRQEREANDLAMAWCWNAVALAVVRKTSKRVGFDPAARMAEDDFMRVLETLRSSPHQPVQEPGQMTEAVCAISERPSGVQFRLQYLGTAADGAASVLHEVVVRAADASAAARLAARIGWPPRTIGFRLIDAQGREVFGRRKADGR